MLQHFNTRPRLNETNCKNVIGFYFYHRPCLDVKMHYHSQCLDMKMQDTFIQIVIFTLAHWIMAITFANNIMMTMITSCFYYLFWTIQLISKLSVCDWELLNKFPAKRWQNFNKTYSNIVERTCCTRLVTLSQHARLVGSGLKMVKYFVQHFRMLHDVIFVWRRQANVKQKCCTRACAIVDFLFQNVIQHAETI